MVKIVTDSTADLPAPLAQEMGISVVPLYVRFGQEDFRDGVDMEAEEFYRRLTTSGVSPTTSAPSPGVFAELYRGLGVGGEGVLSLHLSSKLSATYQAALNASREVGVRVEVVDSLNLSLGLGLLALAAARWAQQGLSLEDISRRVRQAIPRAHLFGLVDTLEYLQRGGRIGRAQAFLGSLLHIKPLLTVKEGEVYPLERARSRPRAVERLCQLAEAQGPAEMVGVLHNTTPEEALTLAERLRPLSRSGEVYLSRFGPVLGCHIGPGALGVAWLRAEG